MLCISFALACLALLGCTLVCMPICLLDNSTIILSLMVMKSLKHVLILVSKTILFFLYSYWSFVLVPFSCMCTNLWYQYYFFILKYMIVISTMLLLDSWLLHDISWPLLVITWHLFDITYHLPPVMLPLGLWLSYLWNPVLISYIRYNDMLPCIIYSNPNL